MQHRRDIEGLRAVAVLAVIAYHAGVPGFAGGFVGVDVFFVISGFLITGILLRERLETGRVNFARFYARRIRRLLPISAVVLATTAVSSALVLPATMLHNLGRDVSSAAFFFVNALFAQRGTNYLAGDVDPSAIQHYWSLAVEEQFYLVWPAMFAAITMLGQRVRRNSGVLLAVVVVTSFALSVSLTSRTPTWAYFGLHTRAFELAIGALVAVSWHRLIDVNAVVRACLGWAGFAGIAVSVASAGNVADFPGWFAAIPVVSTAAMIVSGDSTRGAPRHILAIAPLQWIGARSYSLYLWHWPFLVIAPAAIGRPLGAVATMVVVALSVVVSAIGFRMIENPVRHSRGLSARPGATFAIGGALLVISGVAGVALAGYQPALSTGVVAESAAPLVATTSTSAPNVAPSTASSTTIAAGSSEGNVTSTIAVEVTTTTTLPPIVSNLDSGPLEAIVAALDNPVLPDNVRPDLYNAVNDTSLLYDTDCHQFMSPTLETDCVFGDPDGAFTIGLLGDSHAAQWFSALNTSAINHGWKLVVHTQGGCPVLDVLTWNRGADSVFRQCSQWRDDALDDFIANGTEVIIFSQHWGLLEATTHEAVPSSIWERDLPGFIDRLRDLSMEPILLLDSPDPYGAVPPCAASHPNDLRPCEPGVLRNTEREVRAISLRVAAEKAIGVIDPHVWLCIDETPNDDDDTTRCPVIAGDILVYRDSHHLSNTFVEWVTPVLESELVDWLTSQANS